MAGLPDPIHYKRLRFAAQLPAHYLYTPSHFWLAPQGQNVWRVGLTKFASRMMGEMVDYGFQVPVNGPVSLGDAIGWIEGFKAISDLFCVADGRFAGVNPALQEDVTLVNRDPHHAGWLYAVEGTPDPQCVEVHGYTAILDRTIDSLSGPSNPGEGTEPA